MAYEIRKGNWKQEVHHKNRLIKSQSGFSTEKKALRWGATYLAEYKAGLKALDDCTIEFPKLLQKYRDVHLPTIKRSTVQRYEIDLRLRIEPFFRFYKLKDITPQVTEEFRSSLQRDSRLCNNSINKCTDLLYSIFEKALEWDWIEKNPVKFRRLKAQQKPYRWWEDKADILRFIDGAKDSPYYAAYLLALECGLRLGEVVGLSKQDVSFDLNRIMIHRQWLDKERCYGPTKNSGIRFIDFSPDSPLAAALKIAIEQSPDEEIIFVTSTGKRVGSRNLSGGRFQREIKRLGLPRLTFHDLRHTFASWYMIQVSDIRQLQGILGHSSIYVSS